MSDIDIHHPVPVDECEAWSSTMAGTFLADPHPASHRRGDESRRRRWVADRRWGARADGRWVATLATFGTTLTVPGGTEIAADGLMMVTVAATHKRRGVLTSMLTDSLASARDGGEMISALYAAQWPIYGRFGYSPAVTAARYELDPRLPGAAVPTSDAGIVRQVDADELGARGPQVFAAARRLRAGNVDRDAGWWEDALSLNGLEPHEPTPTYVVHEGLDGADGYLGWAPIAGREHAITVVDLQASNDRAYRGLCEYLTRLDLVESIELPRRPVDEPLRWLLTDGRALRQTHIEDGLWVRLLDVAGALAARRYATQDRLVLEIVDREAGGFAAGRYVLEGGPDGASCSPSAVDGVNLRLDQRALASAFLGGVSFGQQVVRGLIDELTPGAVRRADAMFATPFAPWCATDF